MVENNQFLNAEEVFQVMDLSSRMNRYAGESSRIYHAEIQAVSEKDANRAKALLRQEGFSDSIIHVDHATHVVSVGFHKNEEELLADKARQYDKKLPEAELTGQHEVDSRLVTQDQAADMIRPASRLVAVLRSKGAHGLADDCKELASKLKGVARGNTAEPLPLEEVESLAEATRNAGLSAHMVNELLPEGKSTVLSH